MAEARIIEMMADAITKAQDELPRIFGLFDYTEQGGMHIVRDFRLPGVANQIIASSPDRDKAREAYDRICGIYVARAALSVLAANVSDEMVLASFKGEGTGATMRETRRAAISAALSAANGDKS